MVLIQVPLKVWRSKMKNRYISPDYENDIDEGLFGFKKYGKSVNIPKQTWE